MKKTSRALNRHAYNMPVRATHHCRFYQYQDGPVCDIGKLAKGEPTNKCMPPEFRGDASCPHRVEFTEHERQKYKEWEQIQFAQLAALMTHVWRVADSKAKFCHCPNCEESTARLFYSSITGKLVIVQCSCVGTIRLS